MSLQPQVPHIDLAGDVARLLQQRERREAPPALGPTPVPRPLYQPLSQESAREAAILVSYNRTNPSHIFFARILVEFAKAALVTPFDSRENVMLKLKGLANKPLAMRSDSVPPSLYEKGCEEYLVTARYKKCFPQSQDRFTFQASLAARGRTIVLSYLGSVREFHSLQFIK